MNTTLIQEHIKKSWTLRQSLGWSFQLTQVSANLVEFLRAQCSVECGLVNILYVGLMPAPPVVRVWCQPNGDINITKLSHWTPNLRHGAAAFFWPGSTSAQNKLPSTDMASQYQPAGIKHILFLSYISSNTGVERGDISASNLVNKIWFFIAWEIPTTCSLMCCTSGP